jgi:hypothetical protein
MIKGKLLSSDKKDMSSMIKEWMQEMKKIMTIIRSKFLNRNIKKMRTINLSRE